MKRSICTVAALVIVASFAAAAMAQNSVMFMDIRDNSAATGLNAMTGTPNAAFINGGVNGGKRGAGQILRIDPVHNDNYQNDAVATFPNLDGDTNRATGNLWVYMDVLDDASGTDDVISSVGIDFRTVNPATIKNPLASVSYVMNNDGTVLNSITPPAATPWNGVSSGSASGNSWNDARAVAVPVTAAGPAYSSTNRLVPRDPATNPPYRLGRLRFTSGTRNCAFGAGHTATNSTYNVFMDVDSLLITRTFATGGDTQEDVAMGYNGATPDNNAGAFVNGNVAGPSANNPNPDGVVEVRMKGDFSGDGRVTGADISIAGGFSTAVVGATDTLFQAYCGDFNGSATVTGGDVAGFNADLSTFSPSCP